MDKFIIEEKRVDKNKKITNERFRSLMDCILRIYYRFEIKFVMLRMNVWHFSTI